MARYETVMTLFRQGLSQREIARRCNLNRITVRRFIRAAEVPGAQPSLLPFDSRFVLRTLENALAARGS